MGRCRHTYKSGTLYPGEDHLQRKPAGTTLHVSNCQSAWGTQVNHLRQRIFIYLSILASAASSLGHRAKAQHSISSTDGWTDRASKPNLGRHALVMRSLSRIQ